MSETPYNQGNIQTKSELTRLISRNKFMDETAGMLKNDREMHFESFYKV